MPSGKPTSKETEARILELRAAGKTRKEVCAELGVSLAVVKDVQIRANFKVAPAVAQANARAGWLAAGNDLKEVAKAITPERRRQIAASNKKTYAEKPGLRESKIAEVKTRMEAMAPRDRQILMGRPGIDSVAHQRANIGFACAGDRYQTIAASRGGRYLGAPNSGTHEMAEWECSKGHRWPAKIGSVLHVKSWCPRCTTVISRGHQEVVDFISSVLPGVEIAINDRSVLSGKELDIWIPSLRFGIEFNGLWWHSDAIEGWKSRKERDKAAKAWANDIQFLMVFEDEWTANRGLIEAMILARLGLAAVRLDARKLELRHIEHNRDFGQFFWNNHIDGHVVASGAFGLFNQDVLVSCLSYKRGKDGMEITRLATERDTIVRGGAGRLISALRKMIPTEPLYTYSNNRLSKGAVYSALGAVEVTKTTAPSYYYTDGWKTRYWRARCKRINDPEILAMFPDVPHTELGQAHGGVIGFKLMGKPRPLYRIEDCGHKKWRFAPLEPK